MTTLKRMGCCQSGGFWIADENGEAVAVIPAGRYAKDERQMADKIVLAVNSHDALVEALRRVDTFLSALHDDALNVFGEGKEPLSVLSIRDAARAALEKAGVL